MKSSGPEGKQGRVRRASCAVHREKPQCVLVPVPPGVEINRHLIVKYNFEHPLLPVENPLRNESEVMTCSCLAFGDSMSFHWSLHKASGNQIREA